LKNVLFVCSQNKLRSPTAEQVFSQRPDIESASAGTNSDAETPLSAELINWADVIFVMEKAHRTKLQQRFRASLKSKRIVCLDIPDKYRFMDPELVQLLEAKVGRHLPRRWAGKSPKVTQTRHRFDADGTRALREK
jgi:predicted protein tyrosine phosphatase